MASRNLRSQVSFDWVVLSLFGSIVAIGWLMLYTSSYEGDSGLWFSFDSVIGKQTLWLGAAIIGFIIVSSLDWRIWSSISYPVYAITTISLVAVLLFGKEVKGASSWFSIMGYSFQPSEFAKIGTALGLSSYLSQVGINVNGLRQFMAAMAIILLPAFLIFLQPDAGTAVIFLSFMIPLYRAGLNPIIYLLIFLIAFIFIGSLIWSPALILLVSLVLGYGVWVYYCSEDRVSLSLLILLLLFVGASYNYISYPIILLVVVFSGFYFAYLVYKKGRYRLIIINSVVMISAISLSFGTDWAFNNLLKHHQKERINVWLRPDLSDPHGALYNIIQSKTAIGSGGLTGKGFLDGTMTKLNYVPEQSTDFIFSILGEEQGFIGSASLILLMSFLLYRLTLIGERATLPFVRYFAYSIAGLLFFHFFINIGMTVGIMPVIGIPLPLMSKGGSSLVSFFIMFAILLKMDQASRRS